MKKELINLRSVKDVKRKLVEIFDKEGLVISENDVRELSSDKEIVEMINEVYVNKKLWQFMQYPVLNDLKEHKEIIPAVIQIMKIADHPVREILMRDNPSMTADHIVWYLQSMWRKKDKRNWLRKGIIMGIVGIIVFIIGYLLYK